jgi:hypothetical protein
MQSIVNIYCDESCHLEHDESKVMALGAVWCPHSLHQSFARGLRALRDAHGLPPTFEIKWNKVSKGKFQFYADVVNYFFDNDSLHFRGVVVPDKSALDHPRFSQTHDDFYYKMWFLLLGRLLSEKERFRIYIDIKDAHGAAKVRKLREVLANDLLDFDTEIVQWIQTVRSHDTPLIQLADLLTGALSYVNRDLSSNPAKRELIRIIQERSGHTLRKTTLIRETKFNLLLFRPQEVV